MTVDEAIAFLEAHAPMPDEAELTDELMEQYDQARLALVASPTARAIRPVVFSFGKGSGFGVYQMMDDVLRPLPREQVVDALLEGMQVGGPGVRAWCAELALGFDSERLVPILKDLIRNDVDEDVRMPAISALSVIEGARCLPFLEDRLAVEQSVDVLHTLREVIDKLRQRST